MLKNKYRNLTGREQRRKKAFPLIKNNHPHLLTSQHKDKLNTDKSCQKELQQRVTLNLGIMATLH